MNFPKLFLLIPAWFICLFGAFPAMADECDEARKWYNEGMTLVDNSAREAAYHQKAIDLCPDFPQAYTRLGEIYKSKGDYARAIELLDIAVAKALLSGDPSLVIQPRMSLGDIYRRQGKYEQAIEEFVRVLEEDPESRVANNQLEYLYKRTGKYDDVTDTPREMLTNATFTRISGMTLPKGSSFVDFQYEYWVQKSTLTADMFAEDVPLEGAPTDREAHVSVWVLGWRYGLTNSLTVGVLPKFFNRKSVIPMVTEDTDAEPSSSGLGDTVVMCKYLLYGLRTTYLSALGMLSIPTGETDTIVEDKGVERRIPLGSGSYDATLGLAYSSRFDPVTLHGNVSYMFTDGELVGDQFTANIAASYPLQDYVTAGLELNYRWRDSYETEQFVTIFQGRPEEIGPDFAPIPGGSESFYTQMTEPGGSTLFISPSFQFFLADHLKLDIGVQVPLFKPDDAWAEEAVAHIGISGLLN